MTRNADSRHWARIAGEWIAWARTPNHDAFWAYRDSFSAFIGRGEGEALDIGCGEGRISRELKACGYSVTALDPVKDLVHAAKEVHSADAYVIALGTDLPFAAARFDLVMAYNVLMSIENVSATLMEIRRVLRPDGTLVISIVHPFSDHGRFSTTESDAPFLVQNCYFERKPFEGREERNGLQMHFAGWSRTLEDYAMALEQAGFAISSLREPLPQAGDPWQHMQRWSRMPLFLWLKARLCV